MKVLFCANKEEIGRVNDIRGISDRDVKRIYPG